jgi:autophagy-related protein 11
MSRLRAVPATNEMIKFVTGRDLRKNQRRPTLEDLVDVEDVKRAGRLVAKIATQLNRNGADLGTKVDEVLKRTDDLFDKVEKSPARSAVARAAEPAQLMQDIEAIAKKVSNDYESVLSYPNTAKSVSQAVCTSSEFLPLKINVSQEIRHSQQLISCSQNLGPFCKAC